MLLWHCPGGFSRKQGVHQQAEGPYYLEMVENTDEMSGNNICL